MLPSYTDTGVHHMQGQAFPLDAAEDKKRRRRTAWLGGRRASLAALAALIAAIAVAVAGTLSTFTASGSRTQTISSGTFAFTLTDPSVGPFTTAISGMAPGDFGDRTLELTNPSGGLNYASIALTAVAEKSSLLNTDATNGLQLTISDCSVAWKQTATTEAATCTGTEKTLTASTPLSKIISEGVTYSSTLASLTNGGSDYLRFHYALPTASTGTAGLTSEIKYTFTATQAAGGAYH
jgi:hypothetical protein